MNDQIPRHLGIGIFTDPGTTFGTATAAGETANVWPTTR
jgi:hypothetical protein